MLLALVACLEGVNIYSTSRQGHVTLEQYAQTILFPFNADLILSVQVGGAGWLRKGIEVQVGSTDYG